MNILFLLYGDFSTNTSIQISTFANELSLLGHDCVIAIPSNSTEFDNGKNLYKSYLFDEVFKLGGKVFKNGGRVDILHACTPRNVVAKFINSYLSNWPTPLALHLEDDELSITSNFLGINKDELAQLSAEHLNLLPDNFTKPHEFIDLIKMADLVLLVQEKLEILVPPSIPYKSIYWGVDTNLFSPVIIPSRKWKDFLEIEEGEKIIVYHGGINSMNSYAIHDLCHAIQLINEQGFKCRLIRTGPNSLTSYIKSEAISKSYIIDLGVINREEIPSVLALADVYVQPGRINSFEDLRLPSKMMEFFSMGGPVIVSAVNIANKIKDDIDAIVLSTGSPEQIAKACIRLFSDPDLSAKLGLASRNFALKNFDIKRQAVSLVGAYLDTIANFEKKCLARLKPG